MPNPIFSGDTQVAGHAAGEAKSYGVDFTFRNLDGAWFQQHAAPQRASPSATRPNPPTLDTARSASYSSHGLNFVGQLYKTNLPASLGSGDSLEIGYLGHFQRHVRHLLPTASLLFTDESLRSPCLRVAVLCISASNLSMLNARVQSRSMAGDHQRPVFSPLVNNLHHSQAQKYHDQALRYCRMAEAGEVESQAPAILAAHIILAYYHHASTNHLKFRLAVWDSVRFVLRNRETIMGSTDGADSLQMWYRLCMSNRLAKPPALLLEGEGASSFGPNRFPDAMDQIYLSCIRGMSVDDLIYDILIKSLEIRTRLIVFRCVASRCHVSELSSEIGSIAHEFLSKMLGRHYTLDECAEAREGFVRGPHLLQLLGVQRERLKVWKSRLKEDQLPVHYLSRIRSPLGRTASTPSKCQLFPTHRDAMNALYCMICEMIFEEARGVPVSDTVIPGGREYLTTLMDVLAHRMCQIVGTLDFTTSNISDVYTFSLAESLLQLVFLWRSDAIFHYILDVIWPRLETTARGYEHSHYPTHLVKRIITQIRKYWAQGGVVNFALLAVAENASKLQLLDIHHPIDLVVCGYNKDGKHFIEKIPLP
ncbi:hypothetical protein CNMCM5623_008136 [Aspergillus felis]|uniref:Zn(II)2Cys6 transcription factor n=1 Tax=Aspergillus felis TaxID=1287682 RepID=A0A8H6UKY7_9EURO|nr:hypothetical protein CNMCM5623_008136 [Aspergillus felis]